MDYEETFQSALNEMRQVGSMGIGDWAEIGSPKNVVEYIRVRQDHSEGRNLPRGWIPATTYWLVDEGAFIGETTIRHELTEHLRNVGGQIGYWIRPVKRHQGYGRQILRLALQKAKELRLEKIIITCDATNIGSRKIIESNGGVFEREQDMGPQNPKKLLFWITIQ
ncbi:MAG: Acetyltransferase [Candidatus Peregrinibacteria bacterium Greene0416_19]|nr:MAG: Acetyltransferase [Candidatus Peregrinibacteria bacterium Greene0416_19]